MLAPQMNRNSVVVFSSTCHFIKELSFHFIEFMAICDLAWTYGQHIKLLCKLVILNASVLFNLSE